LYKFVELLESKEHQYISKTVN